MLSPRIPARIAPNSRVLPVGLILVRSGERAVECPCCGRDLQAGSIVIRSGVDGIIAPGYSLMNAWFRPADGAPTDQVLICRSPGHALRCFGCGTVVIASEAALARREERLALASLVGALGTAESSLRPMGEVVVGGKSYVAKSESGVIEKGSRVEVVGAGTRELIVRAKPAEPGAAPDTGRM